jgi:serine/threonine protein kinase
MMTAITDMVRSRLGVELVSRIAGPARDGNQVWKGKSKHLGHVAVKMCFSTGFSWTKEFWDARYFADRHRLVSMCRHHVVLRDEAAGVAIIVMELAQCDVLSLYNDEKRYLEETVVREFFVRVMGDATSMAEEKVFYTDFGLENIGVFSESDDDSDKNHLVLRLLDAGSLTYSLVSNTALNKVAYMSPESFCVTETKGVDVARGQAFSLGVVLYTLIFGFPPFNSARDTTEEHVVFVCGPNRRANIRNMQAYYCPDKIVSDECIDFMSRCLSLDAAARWSIEKLATHPWLSMTE